MGDRQTATWKIVLGYVAFAIAAFVFFFYLTFPFDTVRTRLESEASATGYDLDIGKLGPGLFGVTATNVNVRRKGQPGDDGKPNEPLHIDSVALRPSLFPLGLAFRANAFGGKVTGAVGGIHDLSLQVNLDGVDLSKGNIKGFSGMDLAGTLNGAVNLVVPKTVVGGPNAKGPEEPDFGAANGSIVLEGSEVTVNGGEVNLPSMGGAMGLPRIVLGNLVAKVSIEKGQGKFETLTAKSSDLNLMGSGTLKLAKRLEYSEPNLELKFKLEDELKKRLGPLSMGLTMLQSDPKDPTFRVAHLTGFLGRPNFR